MKYRCYQLLLAVAGLVLAVGCATLESDLEAAAAEGDTETVKVLLAGGADVNAKEKRGMTALMLAAGDGHIETVEVLLTGGADINAKSKDGMTALMLAAGDGHIETVKVLLAGGADVDAKAKDGMTALIRAAEFGHTETVKVLLAGGAEVNVKDKDGMTALIRAAEFGHTKTVKALMAGGADVEAKNIKHGRTALMFAAGKCHTETVNALVAGGAEVNAKDKDGWTALMFAVWAGHTETVEPLLAGGADVNAKEKRGMTALMLAAGDGRIETVEVLLVGGADVDAKAKDGMTALMFAVWEGHTGIVQLLKKVEDVGFNLKPKNQFEMGIQIIEESYRGVIKNYYKPIPASTMLFGSVKGIEDLVGVTNCLILKDDHHKMIHPLTQKPLDKNIHYEEGLQALKDIFRFIVNSKPDYEPLNIAHSAIGGMLESLDPHSTLLPRETFECFDAKGRKSGIGIYIKMRDDFVTVISTIDNTPAQKAGIMSADRIIKVDGKITKNIRQTVNMLRGPKGTKVVVTILRQGVKEPIEIEIVRGVIFKSCV